MNFISFHILHGFSSNQDTIIKQIPISKPFDHAD